MDPLGELYLGSIIYQKQTNNKTMKIKTYKDIDLKYNEQDGRIYFMFEGVERDVKYVFEAERIIDEPRWEKCNMNGYFLDGYSDKYIGLAKAERKNVKNGQPDWKYKGQYDTDYKKQDFTNKTKVYIKSEQSEAIYKKWKKQRAVFLLVLAELNNIASQLKT